DSTPSSSACSSESPFSLNHIIAAHYNPWGFLPLSQGACQPLFEELLLLLQPLSLLPFDLDLLFEPHLLQKGQEHLRRKEQLCSAGQSVDRSTRSTFQLMRGERNRGVGQESQGDGEDGREKAGRKEKEKDVAEEGRQRQERQAGWWYQLMQSSQVYIDQSAEGSKFVKTEKRRKPSERRQNRLPPTREGVVEGAESSQEGEGGESSGSRGRPSWMGSPPDSVLNQEKEAKPPGGAAQEESASQGQGLRWGRLFGAGVGSPTRAEPAEPPSGWLSLDRSVLDLVAQTIGAAGGGKKAEPPAAPAHHPQTASPPPPPPTRPTEARQPSPW
uniref:RUN and SH3 domain containing 1 n=1 Tax=Cyclopterus lumpus TaxID=8103 RepID=A0A8C2XRG5_CYCLU